MARIFWDSNLFIYLIENDARWADRVEVMRRRMLDRGDLLFTSALTLGEVLAKPIALGRADLVDRYSAYLRPPWVTVVPFDVDAAKHYAEIRSDKSIKTPDAIQLACAARVSSNLFVTNDEHLASKIVRGIDFITRLETAPI